MIQDCNIPCKYSAHVLEFDDGTKLEGIDPGIRTLFPQPFVITSYSDEGPFTNPMLADCGIRISFDLSTRLAAKILTID